jgi:hypothetical protein
MSGAEQKSRLYSRTFYVLVCCPNTLCFLRSLLFTPPIHRLALLATVPAPGSDAS